mmetsp:Transcript_41709/g.85269  ORF Transcript_41709/g.85269 Transcript_41709/m.85269 type:complete len:313 (-) Transcript_41709:387-1325(-)
MSQHMNRGVFHGLLYGPRLGGLVVLGRHKRHLHHLRGLALPPHLDHDLVARLVVRALDVAHRDVVLQDRRHGPRRHPANDFAVLGGDLSTLPRRRSLRHQPHAHLSAALGALLDLVKDDVRARERRSAGGAGSLADGPGEAGAGGGGGVVDVVPVKAQPCLQPEGVAGAEARGEDLRLCDEQLPELDSVLLPNKDLEAILSGVTATRDKGRHSVEGHVGSLPKGHALEVVRRSQALHHIDSLRPLDGVQPAVVPLHLHAHVAAKLVQLLLKVFQILRGAPGVDHLVDVVTLLIRSLGDHRVINDASLIVGDE